jgi:Cof subfamily protein (haloacid dehalogenase superfamily)
MKHGTEQATRTQHAVSESQQRQRVKLIVIDVDRTLLTTDRRVLPTVKQALDSARASGVQIALATARSLKGVSHVMREFGLTGPTICFGGAWSGCVESTSPLAFSMSSEQRLELEHVKRACDLAGQHGVDLSWHSAEAWCIPGWNDRFRQDFEVTREDPMLVNSYRELTDRPHKLMFIAPAGKEHLLMEIGSELSDSLHSALSHHNLLEITVKGITKGRALVALRESLSIDQDEVVAIGDSFNDLPMFEAAGYRIAMGNAVPELKARADWVTTTNDDGGVALAIKHLQDEGLLPR